jgi:heme exporter protein D
MTHLPYIAASYGLFLAAAIAYSASAATRLSRATKRLRAIDPRAGR